MQSGIDRSLLEFVVLLDIIGSINVQAGSIFVQTGYACSRWQMVYLPTYGVPPRLVLLTAQLSSLVS